MKEGGEFEKIHNRIDTCSGRLHLRDLHDRGITGKGVSIAIIDQALLVEHEEYKDNLKMYEEIHWPVQNNEAQMHGPAVASIAVGKTVGVAPGADLYYIAEQHGDFVNNTFNWDFTWLAKSIDRILEVNNTLPEDTLLAPMDSRTTASPTGADDYVFYRNGGWSWSIPYIAGLYALSCQVDPEITPDKFWDAALKTGDMLTVERDGKKHKIGKAVNPVKLIDEIGRE